MKDLMQHEIIESKIFLIRGQKVMIDRDLAELFCVENKYLNRQVRNNIRRFPEEFMFQLARDERNELVTFCHRFEAIRQLMAPLPEPPKRRIGFKQD